jgi:hypothetical protein
MRRRRRPLLAATLVGVTAHQAGKRGAQNQAREQSQEERIAELEAQQQYAAPPPQQYAPPPPPPPAPAAAPSVDLVGELTKLKGLMDAGVLTPAEFDAAKAKLLAG